ncbi:sulfite oxidase-like oxidoreductase [Nodosilinea sp. P-1105]|uniref:sulfite oxidase-like oxidoreductase n=1 Tax=Nodosilinea sp. P-1105 TaxID=2546229 RepID=UPI00146AAC15|nr:sulfite oxidase-like oxidoreductase [Nodosilinea sp. P-1105]NMF86124.1 sulfite oxidase-like oxidoreductase [Nodosilinea sp. P-1105]
MSRIPRTALVGKYFHKPGPELRDRVPPGQHLASGFPVLTYGQTPAVYPEDWTLTISGLAESQVFRWDQVMALPQTDFTADFHCVTTWSKLDVTWQGIAIPDLMAQITLDPRAAHVMVHCYGGYTTNLTLEDFSRPQNFLAHTLDGKPLPPAHGGPMRVVVPHLYAWKSAKWISGLEFLADPELGFWERNGYHHQGDPWAEERYSDR